jgi:tight adherence protein B
MTMLAQSNVFHLLVAAAAFGLVLALWVGGVLLWSLRSALRARKIEQRLGLGPGAPAGATRRLRLWHEGKETFATVPGAPPRVSLIVRMSRLCQDAGWNIPPQTLLLGMIGGTIVVFLFIVMITSMVVLSFLGALAVLLIFWIYLKHRIDKRQELFEKQFVDGLELAARSLRAGHPLIASFRVISEEIAAPVGLVFTKICQQQALGVGLDQALRGVATESNSEDLKLFATSVIIQLRSGGNLADMMTRLAAVIRDRLRLSRHVRVLTAQTQFSKRVLIALPILMFMVLNALNPGYLEPLYSTRQGQTMLMLAATGLLVGAWLMNRLATLKY